MPISRYFQLADGSWCAASFSTEGDEFTVPMADHELQISESIGAVVRGVDSATDPRVGNLVPQQAQDSQRPTPPTLAEQVSALTQIVQSLAPEAVAASRALSAG